MSAFPRSRITPAIVPAIVPVALGTAVLAGAALRLLGVGRVVVQGDEVHALRAALGQDFGRIVTDFGETDKCIPLALLGRVLARTIGLDELGLRALPLVAGVALLGLGAVASRRIFQRDIERCLFVTFLASSPVLVFWSRHARPYSIAAFLGAAALLVAARAWTPNPASRRRAALLVAILVTLHAFTLTAAPFTAGLFAAGLLLAVTAAPGTKAAQARRVFVTGAATAAATLAIYAPALASLADVFPEKRASSVPDVATWIGAGRLALGRPAAELSASTEPGTWIVAALPVIAAALLVAIGGLAALRRNRRFACAIAIVLVVPAVAHSVLGLEAVHKPIAFLRYQAASIPIVAALAVLGIGACIDRFDRVGRVDRVGGHGAAAGPIGWTLAFAALAASAATGPLAEPAGWSGSHGLRASSLLDRGTLAERGAFDRFPAFYRELAATSTPNDDEVLVEWPSTPAPRHLYALYEARHGRRILVAFPDLANRPDLRTRFATIVFGREGVERAVGAGALLVVHHDGPAERAAIAPEVPLGASGTGRGREPRRLAPMLAWCRETFGPPIAEDEHVTVFAALRVP